MERLWAPWRIKYMKSSAINTGGGKTRICIFCESIKSKRKSYVIFKTKYSVSLLNIFPYNNGHAMVSPVRHIKNISQLKEIELLDLMKTLDYTKKILDRALQPDGFNIGINISRNAGAGMVGHLHIHIVPRWKGDTNFMPVLYDTKIISQSLNELYKLLKKTKKDIPC